jgi:uncharacterized protein
MSGPAKRLEALEERLFAFSEDAMAISEMDGFIAGLLVCPELISPREWLPWVWGGETLADAPVFSALDDLNAITSSVTAHYNAVSSVLHDAPERYKPLYVVDERTGEIYWQLWAEGFSKAIDLRPHAWSDLLEGDGDDRAALIVLMALGAIAGSEPPLEGDEVDAIVAEAVDIIPGLVTRLHAWRILNQPVTPLPASSRRSTKIGRNDPCPCGSGRKYKKCCAVV